MQRLIGLGILFTCVPLLAQTAAKPTAHVEGKVVDGTGKPVRSAKVRLVRAAHDGYVYGDPGFTTLSDEGGRFSFDVEPWPRLSLTAQKAGYSEARYGVKSAMTPVLFGVKDGETLDLVLTMAPQGVLTGRVVNAAGDPVRAAQVSAIRPGYEQGARVYWSPAVGTTNDLGEFRLAGVPAGLYYVQAWYQDMSDPAIVQLPTLYPSATDEEGASRLRVADGEVVDNLEIRLRTAKGHTVRGKLLGYVKPSGNAAVGFGIEAMPEGLATGKVRLSRAGEYSRGAIDRDGSFELPGMVPGTYILQLRPGMGGARIAARARVIVGEGDVDGVILTLSPRFTVTGKVSVEGSTLAEMFRTTVKPDPLFDGDLLTETGFPTVEATGIRFLLRQLDGGWLRDSHFVAVDSEGKFKLDGVQPGRYVLTQTPIPGTSIKTVRWGDEDVTNQGLEIKGDGKLEVVYRSDAVRATGMVSNKNGQPHEGAQMALWPVEPLPVFNANGIRIATSDRAGAFSIDAMRPGAYYAVALEDIDAEITQVLEFIENFKALAQQVEAKEGSPLILTLELVPAEVVQKALEKLP